MWAQVNDPRDLCQRPQEMRTDTSQGPVRAFPPATKDVCTYQPKSRASLATSLKGRMRAQVNDPHELYNLTKWACASTSQRFTRALPFFRSDAREHQHKGCASLTMTLKRFAWTQVKVPCELPHLLKLMHTSIHLSSTPTSSSSSSHACRHPPGECLLPICAFESRAAQHT